MRHGLVRPVRVAVPAPLRWRLCPWRCQVKTAQKPRSTAVYWHGVPGRDGDAGQAVPCGRRSPGGGHVRARPALRRPRPVAQPRPPIPAAVTAPETVPKESAKTASKLAGFRVSGFVPVSAGHSVSTPKWGKTCQYDLSHIPDLGFCRKPRDEPPNNSPAVLPAGVRFVFDNPAAATTPVFDKSPKLCIGPNSTTAHAA